MLLAEVCMGGKSMQGIIDVMLQAFNSIKAEGSYFILMFAALYVLYRINGKRNQWYIYYILLTLLLVVANPLTVLILSKAFPVLGSYNVFMLMIPALMVIPFAAAELLDKAKDEKQTLVWLLLIAVVIGLSGNLFGLYSNTNINKCTMEQKAILANVEELQEQQSVLVVADESILPFVSTEIPEVQLLYGRDLYQPGMDLGIVDGYSEELLSFYEAMKNPEDTITDILAMADLYGCNTVIVKQFEEAPKKLGHFAQYTNTENYIVYTIQ